MTKVVLPKLNQTGANLWSSVQANDEALQTVVNGEISNENIAAGAAIARSKLEGGAQGIAGTWYTPKVIATEETRESAVFGNMATADEITGVVLPTNGLIRVGWSGLVKTSVASAGRLALFLSGNGVTQTDGTNESTTAAVTTFRFHTTTTDVSVGGGVFRGGVAGASVATTGLVVPTIDIFAAAGTYAVGVQYRATSGNITARERKLWVEVHGV